MAPVLPATSRGLILSILRPADGVDYTNGGLSSRVEEVTLVGLLQEGSLRPLAEDSQVVEAVPQAPAVALRVRESATGTSLCLVPLEVGEDGLRPSSRWTMMGGNFATSHDARLNALVASYQRGVPLSALPLHDRVEA